MVIAALYVRADTVYRTFPRVSVWDARRDARRYTGPYPVICHPPCGRWGDRWRDAGATFPGEGAPEFAHALSMVRRYGGVIEHPARSQAWSAYGLLIPRRRYVATKADADLYAIRVWQWHYGHPAEKDTVFVASMPILTVPRAYDVPGQIRPVTGLSTAQREHTPQAMAEALIQLVRTGTMPIPRGA